MSNGREVTAVTADAQRVGHCNGCTSDDRRVAEVSLRRMQFRLCSACATKLVEDLRDIPAFVLERLR
jgi:hypothetical protein